MQNEKRDKTLFKQTLDVVKPYVKALWLPAVVASVIVGYVKLQEKCNSDIEMNTVRFPDKVVMTYVEKDYGGMIRHKTGVGVIIYPFEDSVECFSYEELSGGRFAKCSKWDYFTKDFSTTADPNRFIDEFMDDGVKTLEAIAIYDEIKSKVNAVLENKNAENQGFSVVFSKKYGEPREWYDLFNLFSK